MATRTFKSIRVFSQLLTTAIVISNSILLILFFMNSRFFDVENQMEMGFIDLEGMYKYTSIMGITLAFFAGCTLNSKIKFYMRLYLFASFFILSVLFGTILYAHFAYITSFTRQATKLSVDSLRFKTTVRTNYKCSSYGTDDCISVIVEKASGLIRFYVIISGFSFVLLLLFFIIVRIATICEINKTIPAIPRFATSEKVGFPSASLRVKRVIEVDSSGNTPIPANNISPTVK
ncbi:hypothetical protein TCON_2321 [Astathelohania contejeani]|uniref:Tetraspanin n=1 Tax=Astathelohania contejeani TaxID=164912 RepID=A0ABQ7HWD0_9MICR|nr:hypothetical protein TCON_2321 [Thelohania contejeani]